MKNFVQKGDVVTLTAPYNVLSGQGVLVGKLFGVATNSADNGAAVEVKLNGVFDLAALNTDTGGVGTPMYWDNTKKYLTTTATNNTLVGCLLAAKANGDTTVRVRLNGTVTA